MVIKRSRKPVHKTPARKAPVRKVSARKGYKITATYGAVFNTKKDAAKVIGEVRKKTKYARFTPIKKVAKGYSVRVQFVMVTANEATKNKAVSGAREQGAKVSVSQIKM